LRQPFAVAVQLFRVEIEHTALAAAAAAVVGGGFFGRQRARILVFSHQAGCKWGRAQNRGQPAAMITAPSGLHRSGTMSYEERDTYGMYKSSANKKGPGPALMGADTLIGDHVHNMQDEHLGEIKEIMLDMRSGKIAYAVMSYGGVLTMGEKLFAVPWSALKLDTANKMMRLDMDKSRVETAPGFDPNDWPDMADQTWANEIHAYYNATPTTH
jgi:sporulation protein YlmC with PRC-barrel domain